MLYAIKTVTSALIIVLVGEVPKSSNTLAALLLALVICAVLTSVLFALTQALMPKLNRAGSTVPCTIGRS